MDAGKTIDFFRRKVCSPPLKQTNCCNTIKKLGSTEGRTGSFYKL